MQHPRERIRAIRTSMCILEPLCQRHAPDLFEQLADPSIYAFIGERAPSSLEALASRYAMLETRRSPDGTQHWLNWAICLADTGPVGYVQATVFADRSADVAYVLAPRYWGRGLAGCASAAMLAELEGAWGVKRFFASADRANARSLRLLEKLGFDATDPQTHGRRELAPNDVLLVKDASPAAGVERRP